MESAQSTTSAAGRDSGLIGQSELDLRSLIDTVLEARWLALGVASGIFLLGVLYALLATPIYRADALIQVEQQPSAIPGLTEISTALSGGGTQSQAEIEIIRSRSVINTVVDSMNLSIVTQPRRFPLLGAAIGRLYEPGEITKAWPGFRRFAWAGEQAVVTRLQIPASMEDIDGTEFSLEAGEAGAFTLYDDDGEELLTGKVGVAGSADTDSGTVEIFVREIMAEPGTDFIIVKYPADQVVEEIQKHLGVRERGKQTGIIAVGFEHDNRQMATDVVNGIVNNYLRQNVERQSEEASRMLAFLDAQLPGIREQLSVAEAALQRHKANTGGAVDISAEGLDMLKRATDIDMGISELELQRSDLRQRYTEQHPTLVALGQKLGQLKESRSSLEGQFKKLPGTELDSIRLLRNVTVSNELYVQLLNKTQELKIAKAGTIGSVRVLDPAILPREHERPNRLLVILLSALLAVFGAVAAVLVRKALRRTIDNPDRIEQQLGLPVYAIIPHSRAQGSSANAVTGQPGTANVLCRAAPHDLAVESLRSLRTSLQFALLDTARPVIAIHGPTPGLGKSFVSANLAALLADIEGSKVLVIDADLRKGHLQETFFARREPGLSECLAGRAQFSHVVQEIEPGRLHFLSTGALPPNPAELLLHANWLSLLRACQEAYTYIVIDCPPLLNLADAMIIARSATTNFVLARAGSTSLHDLQLAQKRFEQSQISLNGVVFNDLNTAVSRYYGSQHYGREYRPASGSR